jgi:hypothetical protein
VCAPTVALLRCLAPHMQIEQEGHVMIRTRGLRGLAVALLIACVAMVAIPAA